MLADFCGEREHVLERSSMFERPLAGALNHRPIGQRIAEGNSQLNHTRARVDSCEDHLTRRGEVGVATSYVGDKRWFIFEVKGHEKFVDCNLLLWIRKLQIIHRA